MEISAMVSVCRLCGESHYGYLCSIVAVDISVYHGGFHSDLNETFFVGNVDDGSRKLVEIAYECMMKGIAIGELYSFSLTFLPSVHLPSPFPLFPFPSLSPPSLAPSFPLPHPRIDLSLLLTVRPGEKYRNIGNEIQRHAQANGFSVVRTYCGHGVNQ